MGSDIIQSATNYFEAPFQIAKGVLTLDAEKVGKGLVTTFTYGTVTEGGVIDPYRSTNKDKRGAEKKAIAKQVAYDTAVREEETRAKEQSRANLLSLRKNFVKPTAKAIQGGSGGNTNSTETTGGIMLG